MSAMNDESESVDQFLARIASLSRKNDDQDAERARKMEEDMLQARKERQARRAERARSISPVKTGPAAPTLPSPRVGTSSPERSIEPPITLTPRSQTQTPSRTGPSPQQSMSERFGSSPPYETTRPLPQPSSPEHPPSPSFPATNAATLSRSGTLSWQQRPTSRGLGSVRGRPFSGSRSPVRSLPEPPKPPANEQNEPEMSRKDIAASLSSRDPAWFRQTQDRGIGSAAYRKTSNDEPVPHPRSSQGMRLPGMSPELSKTASTRAQPSERQSSTVDEEEIHSAVTQNSRLDVKPLQRPSVERPAGLSAPGPKPLSDANDSRPSDVHTAAEAESTLNRSASILGGARSPSPTKGLGGFVQSAMMRRSDSVSKRWSVQSNAGLKRGDSIASNRPIFSPPTTAPAPLGHARTLSRDPRALRDCTSSPLSSSRPSSSHDQSQQDRPFSQPERPASQISNTAEVASGKASPSIPEYRPTTPPTSEPTLSRSPSKTLDPRRWSPTKASWLESALSKPDSPRPAPSKPDPPTWKQDMQRSKSQKDLQESPKRHIPTFEPVSTGGLLRSPPPGTETKLPPLFGATLSKPARSEAVLPQRAEKASVEVTQMESGKSLESVPLEVPVRASEKVQPSEVKDLPAQEISTSSLSPPRKAEQEPETISRPDFRTSLDRPPALKPKPQTPPKTDFRAGLKSRQTGSTNSEANEPEFKAVFGKLKRTQTQNYVAPDVLKDNISRGKAALNTTGGPQPTKRVDEFKESILAKKDAMKQGVGSVHKKSDSSIQEKPDEDVPEALARQRTLHKAKASGDTVKNESPAIQRSTHERPAAKPVELPILPQESKAVPKSVSKSTVSQALPKSLVEPTRKTEPQTMASRRPAGVPVPQLTAPPKEVETHNIVEKTIAPNPAAVIKDKPQRSSANSKQPERSPSPSKEISGKLAARLNPALASLIARGNSPKPQEDSAGFGPSASERDTNRQTVIGDTGSEDTSALQHMTKGRAKGPKRRAPKAEPNEKVQKSPIVLSSTRGPIEPTPAQDEKQLPTRSPWKATASKTASPVTVSKTSLVEADVQSQPPTSRAEQIDTVEQPLSRTTSESSSGPKARPVVASKSPELRRVSNKGPAAEQKEERSLSRPTTAGKSFDIATDGTSQESTAKASPFGEMRQKQEARPLPLTPSKSKLNSPPKSIDRPSFVSQAGKAKSKPTGLGLNLNEGARKTLAADILTPPSDTDLAVPQKSTSLAKGSDETPVSKIIQSFFGTTPRSADHGEFDTEAFLKGQTTEPPRIKTLNKQVWELKGDGKRSPLPPGQEHILFEECMYLCVHTFREGLAAKTSEAYLWTGDSVADAAVEDAQLFCKKIARENSAKLEVVKQGKESSAFFSALGGIVIIRKTKSSALYMLCGRRHLGHVAFDEVEMSAARLCSGFPFLISAKFGKLYLWKGQGSGVDEVSAAKLISMDLSLTGEIEEISEGAEPASFWENFSDSKAFQPSEMWSVRSMNQEKGFPCRLYRVEPERPKSSGGFWGLRASSPPKSSNKVSLQEISPYCQKDLDLGSVHILDSYASIYIIPASSASAKAGDFVSALHVAQEIAVLAPSVQDRSLLPSTEVVFGKPPRDFQAAFRKWMPGLNVDTSKGSACIELAEVLRVLD